jgi:hypothetical protein
MPAALQHVHEADEVAVDVGMRVLQRIAHAGLRRQVDHAVEALAGKQPLHAGAVGDVELTKRKRSCGCRRARRSA